MVRSFVLAVSALWVLAACTTSGTTASDSPPSTGDCFPASSVSGFEPVDDNHVKLTVGPSRHYVLTTAPRITEARFNERLAIRSTNNWICTGNGLGVTLFIPHGIPERYEVTGIERLPEPAPAAPQGS